MKKKYLFAIGLHSLILSSCYYDNREELYPVDPTACNTTSLTYDVEIKPIFSSSCAVSGCHVAGSQLPTLETYSQVFANLDRIEARALIEKSMPPSGPLGQCSSDQLIQWIADGAPEK